MLASHPELLDALNAGQVVARRGAERVALGAKWVAWIDGSKVLAKPRWS